MPLPSHTITKLRGKHERQGRHEAPAPVGVISFATEVGAAEREAFIREWERRYLPSGSVSFAEPRKTFTEAFWEAFHR